MGNRIRFYIERIGRVERERDRHALNAVELMRERDEANAKRIVLRDRLSTLIRRVRELEFKYTQPTGQSHE